MVHRYTVTVAGKERTVELEELGGGAFRVVVNGKERKLDARQVGPGVWSLIEVDAAATVEVDGTLPALTVELTDAQGDRIIVPLEIEDARSAGLAALAHRTSAAGTGPATLRSPMPGRVVKILAQVGDEVVAGGGLVVVEAMKMENELRAPRAGTVSEVKCAEGAAVEAGQELVVIG